MKKYQMPEIEIISFEVADVVTTSNTTDEPTFIGDCVIV